MPGGGRLYDWWKVNQVKNTSKEKTGHPCQMPLEVMKNIIGILPDGYAIADPFGGSGSTMVAALQLGRDCYIAEIDPDYCQIIEDRISEGLRTDELLPRL